MRTLFVGLVMAGAAVGAHQFGDRFHARWAMEITAAQVRSDEVGRNKSGR